MKPTLYKEIFGWFNYEKLYSEIYEALPEGGQFLELGVFMGKSISYMAELVKNGTKNITVYAVDHFKGSDEPIHHEMLKNISLEDVYYANIQKAGLRNIITKKSDSEGAAKYFLNDSLDAVFIDAGHTFDAVTKDLNLWFPKVRHGGIFAGHDYYGSHPEVRKAVDIWTSENFLPFSSDPTQEIWQLTKNDFNRRS